MKTALGDGTTKGIIKSLTDDKNGTGLAKSIDAVKKKIDNATNTAADITADEYNAVQTP